MASVNWASGWGEDGFTSTWEWLTDPAFIVAQAIPYYISGGGGLCAVGIAGWRQRPDPNGPEVVTDHSQAVFNWPGCAYIDNCSSVTFGIMVGGGNQQMKSALNLLYW